MGRHTLLDHFLPMPLFSPTPGLIPRLPPISPALVAAFTQVPRGNLSPAGVPWAHPGLRNTTPAGCPSDGRPERSPPALCNRGSLQRRAGYAPAPPRGQAEGERPPSPRQRDPPAGRGAGGGKRSPPRRRGPAPSSQSSPLPGTPLSERGGGSEEPPGRGGGPGAGGLAAAWPGRRHHVSSPQPRGPAGGDPG